MRANGTSNKIFTNLTGQNMKKNIKPYSPLLRRYAELLFASTFIENWIDRDGAKNGNATFFIKNLIFMILNRIYYQRLRLWKSCGQVNNYFLQNLSKPYILFGSFCYICRRVWSNWGVAFYKRMVIIVLELMDYLKQTVNPFGRRLYYANLKLVPIPSNRFSQFYCMDKEC